MIDSHCHIDLPAFDVDRDDVIRHAFDVGLTRILVPGLTLDQFDTLLSLKQQYSRLDICLGLHPYFLKQLCKPALTTQLASMHKLGQQYKDKIVAIGEAGLDGSLALDIHYQENILAAQIELAAHLSKPLVLHHRQSHNQLISLLKRYAFKGGGVVHAFSGSQQIAETYIDMGFLLGVGGTITYARAKKTRKTIHQIDLQYLLLETDSPDMPLFGYQGKRNSPLQLLNVARALAELKGLELADVIHKTSSNYTRLFK